MPSAAWPRSFVVCGLFGERVLGALLGVIHGGAGFGLKLISLGAGLAMLAMLLFVMGFNLSEIRAALRLSLIHI